MWCILLVSLGVFLPSNLFQNFFEGIYLDDTPKRFSVEVFVQKQKLLDDKEGNVEPHPLFIGPS